MKKFDKLPILVALQKMTAQELETEFYNTEAVLQEDKTPATYSKKTKVMHATKKENTIKVKFVNGSFDMRELYARADELAKEAGWKDYRIIGKGKGNEITIMRTK